jgi:hypothetical protein
MADNKEPENTPKSDDRNIAKVDVETPGLTPEEQLVLLWDKYKTPVVGAALVALVGSAAWFGKKALDEQALKSVQSEFTQAAMADKEAQAAREKDDGVEAGKNLASIENSLRFAQKNSGHPLGGHASFKAGHAYYKSKDFASAATKYGEAARSLANVPELSGLAKLYQALSLWRSGSKDEAKALFEAVGKGESFLHGHRGEAFYSLGVIALEEKNLQEYSKWEAALENTSLTHSQTDWLERLKTFRSQFPKEGFDSLGPVLPDEPPAPPPATQVATSATGGASATGSASPTGK